MQMNSNIEFIEWEGLQKKFEIKPGLITENLPPGIQKIELFRDENYKIEIRIQAHFYSRDEQREWTRKWLYSLNEDGDYTLPNIEFSSGENKFKFTNCLLRRSSESHIETGSDSTLSNCMFELSAYSIYIEKLVGENEQVEWLTEWYLNGFDANVIDSFYSHSTERVLVEKYTRDRQFRQSSTFDISTESWKPFDQSFAELDDISFLIHAAPETLTPTWSRGLGIEYRKEWGGIPDSKTRRRIAEIVGFIGGRKIINVGYTKFIKSGIPIEEYYVNPKSSNITYINSLPERPPVMLKKEGNGVIGLRTEEILKKLVPNYLALADSLKLSELLERYWIFRELPIGNNIPVLMAGIETLAKNYFNLNGIDLSSKFKYMSSKDFDELFREEITSIKKKLEGRTYKDKVLEVIKGSYAPYIGKTATTKYFLEEIGCNTSKHEKKAMKQRNSMIHDSVDLSDSKKELEIYQLSQVSEIFFNRVFLKLLGFEGEYVDYSLPEKPEKKLSQPVGVSSSG